MTHDLSLLRQSRRGFMKSASLAAMTMTGLGSYAGSLSLANAAGTPLSFAGWQGEDDPAAAAEFLKSTGSTIDAVYVNSGDELLTKLRSGGLGSIDVVSQNKDYIPLAIKSKLLQPLDLSRIPNAAKIYPVLAKAPWAQSDGETYAIPLSWGDSPIVWDPKKWDAPPEKYSDLADAKYKGQLVCLDDAYSILWLFSSSLGHPDPSKITQAQLDDVLKLANSVKKNIVLVGSFGDMTDVMVRGDASMAFAGWELMVEMAAAKGAVLKSGLTGKDKGFLWSDAYSIPRDAPNLDAAYAFINTMVGAEANAILAVNTGSGAANADAVALIPAEKRNQYNYALVDGDPATNAMSLSVLPPLVPEGDIVGIAAWRMAWQEFRA